MAVYEIFSRPVLVKYKASICSNATWFFVLTGFIKYICPFIATYFSQGFWKKIDFYREQPDIAFKHQMLVILETKAVDNFIFWSTYENINKAMEKRFLQTLPEIEHREEDYNKDGIKDDLRMTIDIPIESEDIMSVKVLLIFDYKLSSFSTFQMECCAYIHHSSSLPGGELNIVGDLSLIQKEPLMNSGKDDRYNFSVIKESFMDPPTNLEDIFLDYISRNITTAFTNTYPVWKINRAVNQSFIINIAMTYPIETILYQVGFWQLIKWGIVQYICVFIIVSNALRIIRQYVFQNQVFSSIVINPIKKTD